MTNAITNTITIEHIEGLVANEQYIRVENTTMMICVLTLSNGYNVTGESACVDPANFNEAKGKSIARANAVNKIWMLEGYLLNNRLNRLKLFDK